VYIDIASAHGWSIQYVLETHVHADHLRCVVILAAVIGIAILVAFAGIRMQIRLIHH
jgi:glyoxylase-like metal-dependent hydrolase (beta-lactamase superfamily II)